MPDLVLDKLLDRLEQSKTRFGCAEDQRVAKLLAAFSKRQISDVETLLRLHESLLFLRAFPHGPRVVVQSERLLNSFRARIDQLGDRGADLDEIDTFEFSGIAGTGMQDTLSFDVVRWLIRRLPRNVEIAWDDYEEERAIGATWPRFMPLLEEDADVEANIPWRRWLQAARGRKRELEWLIERFESLSLSAREKAELYDSLRLPVRWRLENAKLSRTRSWVRPRSFYYHAEPLIGRKQVSLEIEFAKPAPRLDKLSLREGNSIIERIREVMLVRYRELYGTTLGDPRSVVKAEVGRGVVFYFWNLPPERRLPLRAYTAGFTLKNGVPINYIEAIGLCEWIEVGFNTFYTFRNGETAWIYSQALRCLRRLTGAKCISVYPYQIGQGNDEALESGAFWFYRKLGFRPGRPEILKLTEREEKRIAADPKYKTPMRTLKRLADGHVLYEMPDAEKKAWDRFSTRTLGLRVNRRMAQEFGGDNQRVRNASTAAVNRALGVNVEGWSALERRACEDWALVLALIPDLAHWSSREKRDMIEILRSKAGANEMHYVRLTQKHEMVRTAILKLGSATRMAQPLL